MNATAPPKPPLPRPDTTPASAPDVTAWLAQLQGTGSGSAAQQVYTFLYDELHRAARGHMRRELPEHTLSATALVNEAWLRLAEQQRTVWRNRQHFMAMASTMMRRVLVDHALARRAGKRAVQLQPLDTAWLEAEQAPPLDRDLVAVHEALLALEAEDARAAKVVELKFFGGLEVDDIAAALDISPATVKRDWALARAWLRRELGGCAAP